MGNRVGNPFPNAEWSPQAYHNASYLSVTMGYEFDAETGTMRTKPRFTKTGSHNDEIIEGSPGEVLSNELVILGIGQAETEKRRIDMAFLMGYMSAQLEQMRSHG